MTEEFIATENGNIKIAEEVIVRISAISAREVDGVAALGSGASIGDFIGKKTPAKGIKVETADDRTIIDVHVTVKFGVRINEVAERIQEAVKSAVEEYAGIENCTVNVFADAIENVAAEETRKEEK